MTGTFNEVGIVWSIVRILLVRRLGLVAQTKQRPRGSPKRQASATPFPKKWPARSASGTDSEAGDGCKFSWGAGPSRSRSERATLGLAAWSQFVRRQHIQTLVYPTGPR